jgi:3'(2'), 5'-bisphosphate nucleotidase
METLYLGIANGAWGMEPGAWKTSACSGKSLAAVLESLSEIQVSGKPTGKLKVVASKSHCNDETRSFISELEEKYGEASLVSRGSSLKLCMVAEGSADIYPRIAPTMEWDTAAADAVVRAAGGKVFKYNDQVGASDYVCSNKNIQELPYNKENLLNPYFTVSGLHE